MSSWVQLLLLVVLAACLRFGVAVGDPLPAALVELVRNSPISSIEDLQMLLLSDSVDEEDGTSAANGGHRLPRSLDAQPAQQALCKVRTEVVEVTRAMLDRSNANFLLWPPCVEVQRCSGCCNTKSLQCVPFVTHTRHLQVMKIEYMNQKAIYANAVVSVVDHVECRCQPAPPPPRKKSSRRQHGHQNHRNQTHSADRGHAQAKVQSKDELHQWDELKHNQRAHLEDLLEQQWSPRGDTFNQPQGGYSLPGPDGPRPGEAFLFATHWGNNSRGVEGAESERRENVGRQDVNMSHSNKTVSVADNVVDTLKNKLVEDENGPLLNDTEGNQDKTAAADTRGNKSELTQNHSSDVSRPVTQHPPVKHSPTEEALHHRVGSRFGPTKEPNPDPRGQGRRRQNETPQEERVTQVEDDKLEEKRRALLLLHKSLDQEKEIVRQQQMKREEEERQRQKETDGRHHAHGKHHHLLTTQKPVTSPSTTSTTSTTTTTTTTTTTRRPAAPTGPRPPAQSNHVKRRMRKNRKRISKAAMRAMLM